MFVTTKTRGIMTKVINGRRRGSTRSQCQDWGRGRARVTYVPVRDSDRLSLPPSIFVVAKKTPPPPEGMHNMLAPGPDRLQDRTRARSRARARSRTSARSRARSRSRSGAGDMGSNRQYSQQGWG